MGKADNMDRIQKIFRKCRDEKRKALVIFNSCGFPDEKSSEELIGKSIEAGADIIELGVPFSDPIADGVMIQKASQIALKNGITLKKILAMAQRIRARYPDTGLILFSYFNVMMNYGLEALAAKLEQIGVDGILAVDVPHEESGELKPLCAKHHLHLIPLVSPTTSLARAEMIMRDATGFVYYVTVRGVTGERSNLRNAWHNCVRFPPFPLSPVSASRRRMRRARWQNMRMAWWSVPRRFIRCSGRRTSPNVRKKSPFW